jgi:hypothetical protein
MTEYLNISMVAPRVVSAASGGDVRNLDVRVRLEAIASGRVLDQDGEPLAGMRVIALGREYSRSDGDPTAEFGLDRIHYVPHAAATTDDRGHYELNLRAGRPTWILAYHQRSYDSPIAAAPADPRARAATPAPTYSPSGATLDSVPPLVLRSFEERQGVDISMRRMPSYCLDAVLTKNGLPASLAFRVEEEDLHRVISRNSPRPSWRTSGRSGPDGRIRVCNLHEGRFLLTAFETVGVVNTTHFRSVALDVHDADLNVGTVEVQSSVTIAGNVRWDTALPPERTPAPVRIGIPLSFGNGATVPAIPGEFSLTALPGEPHGITVSGLQHPFYVKAITFNGTSVTRSAIVPGGSANQRLTVTIGSDAGRLDVRVRDRAGRPAAHVPVLVLADKGTTDMDLARSIAAAALSDESGNYTADGLPPGRYYVLTTPDLPSYVINLPMGTLRVERSPEAVAMLLRARATARRLDVGPRATISASLEAMWLE